MFSILTWWLLLFLFNFPAGFISRKIFKDLPDQGYAVTKILGIVIVSYIVWLLGSFKILPFTTQTIIGVFFIFSFLNIFFFDKKFKISKIMVFEEILFGLGLALWCLVRSYRPEILGLEKFTDFSMVNAAFRTEFFPPKDPWLAGSSVNYYYFGQYVTSLLGKISGINLATVYNLQIATIFGLTFSAAFSILYNLTKNIKAGIFAGLLITLSGNLHTIYAFTQGYPVGENMAKPFWELLGKVNFSSYWYPMAVRFVPYVISEFPAYSFTVADLHAHLLDIPFVLLTITLIMAFKPVFKNIIVTALTLAVLFMTNSLDCPIYLALLFLITKSLKVTVFIAFITFILALPFTVNFTPFVSGIRINDIAHTPIYMFLILWGLPIFLSISYLFSKNKIKIVTAGLILSFALIIFPEIAYFKDIYPLYFRANTVFKLGYQAFIMFSLFGTYIIFKNKVNKIILAPLLLLVFLFPYFSLGSYYSFNTNKPESLDGLTYLKNSDLGDYETILWLNKNITGQKIILEAVGESYTNYSRISTNTGLVTVLGWPGHEWGWHMSPNGLDTRRSDVSTIYETHDIGLAKNLLSKYQVEYIIVGNLEREKYKNIDEEKFKENFQKVFQSNRTTIYLVPRLGYEPR